MGKHSDYEIKSFGKDLTKDQLKLVFESWVEEQDKWDELENSNCRHYMESDTWGDLFHHEIVAVDSVNRFMIVKDHSQPHKDRFTVNTIPTYGVFRTEEEAVTVYSEKIPRPF